MACITVAQRTAAERTVLARPTARRLAASRTHRGTIGPRARTTVSTFVSFPFGSLRASPRGDGRTAGWRVTRRFRAALRIGRVDVGYCPLESARPARGPIRHGAGRALEADIWLAERAVADRALLERAPPRAPHVAGLRRVRHLAGVALSTHESEVRRRIATVVALTLAAHVAREAPPASVPFRSEAASQAVAALAANPAAPVAQLFPRSAHDDAMLPLAASQRGHKRMLAAMSQPAVERHATRPYGNDPQAMWWACPFAPNGSAAAVSHKRMRDSVAQTDPLLKAHASLEADALRKATDTRRGAARVARAHGARAQASE